MKFERLTEMLEGLPAQANRAILNFLTQEGAVVISDGEGTYRTNDGTVYQHCPNSGDILPSLYLIETYEESQAEATEDEEVTEDEEAPYEYDRGYE